MNEDKVLSPPTELGCLTLDGHGTCWCGATAGPCSFLFNDNTIPNHFYLMLDTAAWAEVVHSDEYELQCGSVDNMNFSRYGCYSADYCAA